MVAKLEVKLGGTLQLLLREIEEEPVAFFTVTFGNFTLTARGDHMAYTLPVDKQVKVKVSYVDAQGNPASVDGAVRWSSSDDKIAEVFADEVAEKSFEAVVVPRGVGQVQILADVDADMGDGVRPLATLMDIAVIAGEAVAGVIEPVGAPGDIPHPEPQ
jgi:hypothetical protein